MKIAKEHRLIFFVSFILPQLFFSTLLDQTNAQPQYQLTARNFFGITYSQFQFDIYISRTGGGTEPYVKGQFVLTYNSAILPAGGTLSMSYVAGSSQLPAAQQSTNCLAYSGGAPGYALYIKAPLDNYPGAIIPDYPVEIRLGTYRVTCSLPFNNNFLLNPAWRYVTPNPFTKLWYNDNNTAAQLTLSYINFIVSYDPCIECPILDYEARLINDGQANNNTYEFDIYFKDISYPYPFRLYGIQICLLLDNAISNGGILNSVYIPGTSEMNSEQIPSDPDINGFVGNKRVWKLTPKFVNLLQASYLSSMGLGTRLGRFRITTTAPSFAHARPNLAWNFDSLLYGYTTQVYYFFGMYPTILTNTARHYNYLSNPILPVDLISFAAKVANNREVFLTWSTATETNNYGFEIQRKVLSQQSAVSNNDFEKIGFVAGSGNSSSPKSYSYFDRSLSGGSKFAYRLKQIDNNGTFSYSSIQEVELILDKYILSQNYPNPFNPTTKIEYMIPQNGNVTLSVYDLLGEKVDEAVNEFKERGIFTVEFDARNLSSGTYLYILRSNGNMVSKKMTVLR